MWDSFDKIYCLTLKNNKQRQNHARQEFKRVGITDYEFFYGVTANDKEVRNLFINGRVFSYPGCFRCKKNQCRCENNFLIPSQVACFKSFQNIFKAASESEHETFLVMEDDVEFEPYYDKLAKTALTRETLKKFLFFSEFPCLLSLGQNLNHGARNASSRVYRGNFLWSMDDVTECNVTFAFNKSFAKLAQLLWPKIQWTADTYIHRFVGKNCLHFSLFPRISHDLSWSTGKLKSDIHPKKLYFTQNHSAEDKRNELERFKNHIQRVTSKQEYDKYIKDYLDSTKNAS